MSRIRHRERARQPTHPDSGAPVVASGNESLAVSAIAADFPAGHRIPRHRHERAQLVYAVEGVMTVKTSDGMWVVPPLRALWVPAGAAHSIRMTGNVAMRTIYFAGDAVAGAEVPSRPTVLSVSPLLREIIVRLVEVERRGDGAGALQASSIERLTAVLLDEIRGTSAAALELPVPSDARLRRITEALLADPADARD